MEEFVFAVLADIEKGKPVARSLLVDLTFRKAQASVAEAPLPSMCLAAVNRVLEALIVEGLVTRLGRGRYLLADSQIYSVRAAGFGDLAFAGTEPNAAQAYASAETSPLPQTMRDWVAHPSILCVDDATMRRIISQQDDAL